MPRKKKRGNCRKEHRAGEGEEVNEVEVLNSGRGQKGTTAATADVPIDARRVGH